MLNTTIFIDKNVISVKHMCTYQLRIFWVNFTKCNKPDMMGLNLIAL